MGGRPRASPGALWLTGGKVSWWVEGRGGGLHNATVLLPDQHCSTHSYLSIGWSLGCDLLVFGQHRALLSQLLVVSGVLASGS
jgi:hypothetical protein